MLLRPLLQQTGADEQHAAEVEVVADAAQLVVDDRVLLHLAPRSRLPAFFHPVGIDQYGFRVVGHAHHAFQCPLAHLQCHGLGHQQGVGGVGLCGQRA